LYQYQDSCGLFSLNSNLPAVVLRDVCVRHGPIPRKDKH